MAWCGTGAKPLPEPMVIEFSYAFASPRLNVLATWSGNIETWMQKLALIWNKAYPANKLRNKYIIITSKRRFDVIMTYLLRTMFAGYMIITIQDLCLVAVFGCCLVAVFGCCVWCRWILHGHIFKGELRWQYWTSFHRSFPDQKNLAGLDNGSAPNSRQAMWYAQWNIYTRYFEPYFCGYVIVVGLLNSPTTISLVSSKLPLLPCWRYHGSGMMQGFEIGG